MSFFFFDDGKTCIFFKKGDIDKYCVFINSPPKYKLYAPKDVAYFTWILKLYNKYGIIVYFHFVRIYNIVDKDFNYNLAKKTILDIDAYYEEDTRILWTVFYMTMLAEERKESEKKVILGKMVKHLGVFNVLFDGYDIEYVAEYMKEKHWYELADMLKERNIYKYYIPMEELL